MGGLVGAVLCMTPALNIYTMHILINTAPEQNLPIELSEMEGKSLKKNKKKDKRVKESKMSIRWAPCRAIVESLCWCDDFNINWSFLSTLNQCHLFKSILITLQSCSRLSIQAQNCHPTPSCACACKDLGVIVRLRRERKEINKSQVWQRAAPAQL